MISGGLTEWQISRAKMNSAKMLIVKFTAEYTYFVNICLVSTEQLCSTLSH